MSGGDRLREALRSVAGLVEPPAEDVVAVAVYLRAQLAAFSDNMEVDSGFGFGEACLDFQMDGKAIRVVVSEVPEHSQEPTHD